MNVIENIKNFISNNLTPTDKTIEKIRETINKIAKFINCNKSFIFFGLTVLFAYYMTPVAAFEYFYKFSTLREVFVEGTLFAAAVFVIKNIFVMKPLTKSQDDKINYLVGFANIAETYLNPTQGFITAAATCGFIAIKIIFEKIFESDEKDIYFLVEQPGKKS